MRPWTSAHASDTTNLVFSFWRKTFFARAAGDMPQATPRHPALLGEDETKLPHAHFVQPLPFHVTCYLQRDEPEELQAHFLYHFTAFTPLQPRGSYSLSPCPPLLLYLPVACPLAELRLRLAQQLGVATEQFDGDLRLAVLDAKHYTLLPAAVNEPSPEAGPVPEARGQAASPAALAPSSAPRERAASPRVSSASAALSLLRTCLEANGQSVCALAVFDAPAALSHKLSTSTAPADKVRGLFAFDDRKALRIGS
jgi:hypothetical protein